MICHSIQCNVKFYAKQHVHPSRDTMTEYMHSQRRLTLPSPPSQTCNVPALQHCGNLPLVTLAPYALRNSQDILPGRREGKKLPSPLKNPLTPIPSINPPFLSFILPSPSNYPKNINSRIYRATVKLAASPGHWISVVKTIPPLLGCQVLSFQNFNFQQLMGKLFRKIDAEIYQISAIYAFLMISMISRSQWFHRNLLVISRLQLQLHLDLHLHL